MSPPSQSVFTPIADAALYLAVFFRQQMQDDGVSQPRSNVAFVDIYKYLFLNKCQLILTYIFGETLQKAFARDSINQLFLRDFQLKNAPSVNPMSAMRERTQ